MTTALFDMDYIKYQIAGVCEKRTVDVLHKESGKVKNYANRTEFYGHHKKKAGGYLAELNAHRAERGLPLFKVEDFEFTDRQEAKEPLAFALKTVKNHIIGIQSQLCADDYYGYIGKGDSWRVEASTIVKYKGSRAALMKPIYLDDIEKYLIKEHHAKVVRGKEADDQCVIDCTENPDLILAGVDKDYFGNNLKFYIHNSMEQPFQIEGFGALHLNDKGDVKGHGYLWWLFQVCSGDDSDEYWANSACPEKKWGDKSAYKALKDCKNEKEAWEATIAIYNKLYPEPRVITGWRGDEIEVDARYVLNENCVMSRMMTSDDYKFILDEELDKYGVKL
jgi:hypothetical protein